MAHPNYLSFSLARIALFPEERFRIELHPERLAKNTKVAPVKADQWTAHVRRALKQIEGNVVGGIALQLIASHGRWVWVEPYWTPEETVLSCNAATTPWRETHGGRMFYSKLQISPERHGAGSACAERSRKEHGKISEDHETLLHELVHAYRHVSESWGTEVGNLDPRNNPGGGLMGFKNLEEFIAVLVANVYMSQHGGKVLRASHRHHFALPSALSNSFGFYEMSSHSFTAIDYVRQTSPKLFDQLAKVDVPFNPMRAFVLDKDKAKRLSEGARAARRDKRGDAQLTKEAQGAKPVMDVEKLLGL